jgi:hypothetical protein
MATKPEDLVKIYITAAKDIIDSMKAHPDHFLKNIDKLNNESNLNDVPNLLTKINRRRGPVLGNIDYVYVFPNTIFENQYIDDTTKIFKEIRAITLCVNTKQIVQCNVGDRNRQQSLLFDTNNKFNMIPDNSYYQRDTMLLIVKDLMNRAFDIIISLAVTAPDVNSIKTVLGELEGGARKTRKSKK